jgi:osmotically-inducible protein OsmY
VVERVGKKVDDLGRSVKNEVQDLGRGVKTEVREVTDGVRKRFEAVRADVHRMDIHSRVYSRLHWDKSLHGSRIEVHMFHGGVVLLRGSVPSVEAKKKAVELAAETSEVTAVVDELTAPPPSAAVGAAPRRPIR